jgi:hypothetical protein
MKNLLQRVIGVGMLSMLDGFLGYNQMLVKEEDINKNAFTTPWGTCEYLRMLFELMNAGSTFHKAMDYAFRDLIKNIVEIYEDGLTIFSKDRKDHICHMRQIFDI